MKRDKRLEALRRSDFTAAPVLMWRHAPWAQRPMPLYLDILHGLACALRRVVRALARRVG